MLIENRKEDIPLAHYEELFRRLNPEEISARRQDVKWDGKEFYVNLLGRELGISHPEGSFRALDGGALPSRTVRTFILRYLLESKNIPWLGQWKTFREMPWGEVYSKAFSGRALTRAAFTFGQKLRAFRAACEKIGGTPVDRGDAGWEFSFIGNYKMQILIWEGDEEFPPSAQILYSDNFAEGFTAEDRVVAADILISTIKNNM